MHFICTGPKQVSTQIKNVLAARESPSTSAGFSACYLPGTLDKDATPRPECTPPSSSKLCDYETCSHGSDMYCTTRQSIETCIYDKPNKTLSKMAM